MKERGESPANPVRGFRFAAGAMNNFLSLPKIGITLLLKWDCGAKIKGIHKEDFMLIRPVDAERHEQTNIPDGYFPTEKATAIQDLGLR